MKLDRYKTHDIELVVDRVKMDKTANLDKRLEDSVGTAMEFGDNSLLIIDLDSEKQRYFSRNLMCPDSGLSYPKPEPNSFSFNSPKGMCPNCKGLGCNRF